VAVVGALAVARGRQGQKSLSKSELDLRRIPYPVETARALLPSATSGVFSHEIHLHEPANPAAPAVPPKGGAS
jgi:hypothetical protein